MFEVPPVTVSEEGVNSVETYLSVSVFVPDTHVTTSAVGDVAELPVIVSPTVKAPDAPLTTIVAVVLDETILPTTLLPETDPPWKTPVISLTVN